MNILDKMKSKTNFTGTELVAIEYILNNKEKITSMTINDLAKETYSSNATIIRACRKIGFNGYSDFKISFLKELESNKYIVNNIDYSIPFHIKESTDTIVNSIFSLYKESINLIQSQLDIKTLEKMIACLISSERIFIYAIGDAKITAMSFINKLIKINYFPILATDNNEEFSISNNLTKKDCAVFITYGGKYRTYDNCMKILSMRGVNTIVLTANEESYLYKKATFHLSLPDREKDDKIATFYSQLGFSYLLSVIYSLIYNTYKAKTYL